MDRDSGIGVLLTLSVMLVVLSGGVSSSMVTMSVSLLTLSLGGVLWYFMSSMGPAISLRSWPVTALRVEITLALVANQ